jgi:quinolinate synthase
LADAASAYQIREARKQHPNAVVVSYVNTTAEVKAESDLCCTSANKEFCPATDYLVCPTMKLTGLQDVVQALEAMTHVITVEDRIRVRARIALDAMLEAGQPRVSA